MSEPTVPKSVRLKPDIALRLEAYAAATGKSQNVIIGKALEEYLQRMKEEK